jgi:hypothetical protein
MIKFIIAISICNHFSTCSREVPNRYSFLTFLFKSNIIKLFEQAVSKQPINNSIWSTNDRSS